MATKKKGLTRDEVLARLRKDSMEPFELDGDTLFYIKEMSLADKRAIWPKDDDGNPKKQADFTDYENEQFGVDLLSRCIVDEDGKQLFPDKEDVEQLEALGARTLARLLEKATGLNMPDPEMVRKNSETPLVSDSSTSSPDSADAPIVN